MRRTTMTALVLAGLLMIPTGLAAQERQREGSRQDRHDRMGAMGMMMRAHHGAGMMGAAGLMPGRMMGMMVSAPTPGHILMQGEVLGLSDDQAARLEAIQEDLRAVHQRHMEEIGPIRDRLETALDAESGIDVSAYESALKELSDHHVQMAVTMARSSQEALDVLADEQRSRVRYGMRLMRHMMGQGMMGRMMGHGMMRGFMMPEGDDDGTAVMRGPMHHHRSGDGR